mgnify:CR=1 FL=1
MYTHNDMVAREMKNNISDAINKAYDNEDEETLDMLVSAFTGYSFGSGYELEDIKNEGINTIANVANWQMHEEYSYLCSKELVPRTGFMMVGFEQPHYVYDGRFASNGEMASFAKEMYLENGFQYKADAYKAVNKMLRKNK